MEVPWPAYPTVGQEGLDGGDITSSSKFRPDIVFTAGNRLVTHGLPCAILNYYRAGSRISGKTNTPEIARAEASARAFSYYQFN